MVLCLDDMAWIMPLLRQAAPKWKKILMKIGIQNDTIMSMRDDTKEEELLLNKGVRRWLQQKQGSPKVTLGDLATALSSPEVGEGDLASDIVKGKRNFHRPMLWLSVVIRLSVFHSWTS